MKFLGITLFLTAALFWQCEKGRSNVAADAPKSVSANSETAPEKTNMAEVFRSAGKKGDVEYEIVGRKRSRGKYDGIDYPSDNLVVEYSLKNSGAKDLILFNQGHFDSSNRDVVYVAPQTDGGVEIGQRAFIEPANCPARDFPITPRGAWLRAGETVRGKVFVELPLKQKTPFDDCAGPVKIAPNAAARFCLGFQAADKATKIDANGAIAPLPDLKNQDFLCSESFEIE